MTPSLVAPPGLALGCLADKLTNFGDNGDDFFQLTINQLDFLEDFVMFIQFQEQEIDHAGHRGQRLGQIMEEVSEAIAVLWQTRLFAFHGIWRFPFGAIFKWISKKRANAKKWNLGISDWSHQKTVNPGERPACVLLLLRPAVGCLPQP